MSIERICLTLLLLMFAEQVRADETVDYVRQIKPVLQSRCYACHGVLKQAAKLRLDTAEFGIQGGRNGAVIVPGDVAASRLIERISASDESERMPPEGEPLSVAQIALLKAWIAQGAKAPADEKPEQGAHDHWAFKPAVRPVVPTVNNSGWVRNPVDAFIAAEHQQRGLAPQRPADKRVWLRRVTLDLIGLPPTTNELNAFVADMSPDAYDKVVTRLLDSPHYGERWGRHWMDIWRYSDWWGLGADVRNSQKHIWHWRDWIIESLNADKGYDQMLREMLAADELYPDDWDRLRASGFLARQYFIFNRTSWLDETIEHTSKAMLGLTFNCAKCHDHKYDPFSQVDYYSLRAFFEPYQVRTDAVPSEIDFAKDGIPRAFDCNLDATTYLHIRGDDRNSDKSRLIEPALPKFLSFGELKIEPVQLPLLAVHPGLRPFVEELYLQQAQQKIADLKSQLEVARKKLVEAERAVTAASEKKTSDESTSAPQPSDSIVEQARLNVIVAEKSLVAAEVQPAAIGARAAADRARYQQPPTDNVTDLVRAAALAERIAAAAKADEIVARAEIDLLKAATDKKGDAEKKLATARTAAETAHKAVEISDDKYTSLAGSLKTPESNLETEDSRRKPFPATSTGRRTALARWITDPRHPLPARVAVNHIWARHFGAALVPTVFDFGRKGTPPTHPALLDWLAVELVEHGWSMKHIHRLIVTSNTYRMTSSSAHVAEENITNDAENRFYWRMNPLRMEAQLVRDSLLSLAGELDAKIGGPPIPVKDENSRCRSLYFVHSHNEHEKFLSIFDDANVLECYRRATSIVPQQALALENSELVNTMAEKIGQRIAAANPSASDDEFLRAAFLTVLSIEPTTEELATARKGLAELTDAARRHNRAIPTVHARNNLIRALLNHNDFVTIR